MKTVLITGGTGTIGRVLVEKFSENHKVFFTYNSNIDAAKELSEKFQATAIKCNIGDINDTEQLKCIKADVLINNVGISEIKMFTDITFDDWNNMININLNGAFYVTKAIIPYMIKQKRGSIINISSIWGRTGASCEVHYSAAKAGIIGFTKALAKEVGLSGISVNCVAPGVIKSEMNSHLSDEELSALIDETPLSKIGTPYDVAEACLYLTQTGFVTGQILGVDGGFVI